MFKSLNQRKTSQASTSPDDPQTNSKALLWIGTSAFFFLVLSSAYQVWKLMPTGNITAQTLSGVILVGLALVVALVILLAIIYKVIGVENANEALGLPSGSIRALIAFCLVIMFISLAVFLYDGVSTPAEKSDMAGVTQATIDKLKTQFDTVLPRMEMKDGVAVRDPAAPATCVDGKDKDGKTVPATITPACFLYDVTYYSPRSKDSSDFAKQIFTQLGTVFVTVIGFYFGSSTASAGVKTGVTAAGGPPQPTDTGSTGVGQPLNDAIRADSDASKDLARIQAVSDNLSADGRQPPADPDKLKQAKALLDTNNARAADIKTKLASAQDAAAKFGTMSTDADNAAESAAVLKASNDIKALAAQIKTDANTAEALLK